MLHMRKHTLHTMRPQWPLSIAQQTPVALSEFRIVLAKKDQFTGIIAFFTGKDLKAPALLHALLGIHGEITALGPLYEAVFLQHGLHIDIEHLCIHALTVAQLRQKFTFKAIRTPGAAPFIPLEIEPAGQVCCYELVSHVHQIDRVCIGHGYPACKKFGLFILA